MRQPYISFSYQYVSDATLPEATTSGRINSGGRKRCHSTRRPIPLRLICDKPMFHFRTHRTLPFRKPLLPVGSFPVVRSGVIRRRGKFRIDRYIYIADINDVLNSEV